MERRSRRLTVGMLAALTLLGLHRNPWAQAPSPASAQSSPTFTLRTGTDLVLEDVVVRGPDGKPVHGLHAADFTLRQDGVPQKLRSFTEVSAKSARALAGGSPRPPLGPGLFTDFAGPVPGGDAGPLNILLIDMLNTPLQDQAFAREQSLRYLRSLPAGTTLAVFGLNQRLTILQGFTADPALLQAALRRKAATGGSALLNDPLGGGGGVNPSALSEAAGDLGSSPDELNTVANLQQFEAENESFQTSLRTQFTLDALEQLGEYLRAYPGRKNLIWLSGSVPVDLLPNTDVSDSFAAMRNNEAQYRRVMALLARTQVAMYPVDVRGLQTTGQFNAGAANTRVVTSPPSFTRDLAKFDARIAADNDSMLTAARDTGGRAFVNTNGLAAAIRDAVDDGSHYYSLTFSPEHQALDGRFHKLSVSVRGGEYTLEYRPGYYARSAEAPASGTAAVARTDATTADGHFRLAMQPGAPAPHDVTFTARVLPDTGVALSAGAAGVQSTPGNRAPAAASWLIYAVDFAVDPRAFAFITAGADHHGSFQVAALVFDAEGVLVNRLANQLRTDLTPATFASFEKQPFSYNLTVAAPKGKGYTLRLGICDDVSGRVGVIVVPLDAIAGLKPLHPALPEQH